MRLFALCLVLLSSLALTEPAWAAISRDEAAVHAQRASGGGRVLSVDKVEQGGRTMYRVKVLTGKGEVRVVLVDAESGAVQ